MNPNILEYMYTKAWILQISASVQPISLAILGSSIIQCSEKSHYLVPSHLRDTISINSTNTTKNSAVLNCLIRVRSNNSHFINFLRINVGVKYVIGRGQQQRSSSDTIQINFKEGAQRNREILALSMNNRVMQYVVKSGIATKKAQLSVISKLVPDYTSINRLVKP